LAGHHLSAACAEPAVIAVAAIAAPTKSVACFIDELPLNYYRTETPVARDAALAKGIFARIQHRRNLILRATALFSGAACCGGTATHHFRVKT
jgi:hypothetical protein